MKILSKEVKESFATVRITIVDKLFNIRHEKFDHPDIPGRIRGMAKQLQNRIEIPKFFTLVRVDVFHNEPPNMWDKPYSEYQFIWKEV